MKINYNIIQFGFDLGVNKIVIKFKYEKVLRYFFK